MMYSSSIETDDEYACADSDNLVPSNEGRRLSDVGRYRQSRMRLKSSARRTFGSSISSGGGSSEQQKSLGSSAGSFGADTSDSINFASFDSVSSRGSCCSLPSTRQRASLAKTPWPRKQNPRLLHQYSDSAVFSSRRMHQDLKMARLGSERSTDSPRKYPVEPAIGIKGAKTGPHPRKKMLRSQSESAIDVSMIRPLKKGGAGGTDAKPIVVSNDDLLKILAEANKFAPSKRRAHKVVPKLEATQEIQETEATSEGGNDNKSKRLSPKSGSPEKEGSKLKGKGGIAPRISRHSSLHVNLPNRASLSTSSLRSRAADVLQLSPVHRGTREFIRPVTPPGVNKNCLVPPSTSPVVIRDRPLYGSTLPRCPSPSSELEPIIKSDANGNTLLEEDEEEAEQMEEKQIQKPSPKPQSQSSDIVESENIITEEEEEEKVIPGMEAFDPSLLGEAIERHLSLTKTSPSRKKTRSGAALWKGLLNQDKLGSIFTKFPFKKDSSSDGVTA